MPYRLTLAHPLGTGQAHPALQIQSEDPPPTLSPERDRLVGFSASSRRIVPPLPWPVLSPPFSMSKAYVLGTPTTAPKHGVALRRNTVNTVSVRCPNGEHHFPSQLFGMDAKGLHSVM
jgi:hypothetical protein